MFNFLDERIQEYDFDAVLFDEQSEFQRVQIFHSPTFGNALILDHLISKLISSDSWGKVVVQNAKLLVSL